MSRRPGARRTRADQLVHVRTLRGLEPLAAAELRRVPGVAVVALRHRTIVCRCREPERLRDLGLADDALVVLVDGASGDGGALVRLARRVAAAAPRPAALRTTTFDVSVTARGKSEARRSLEASFGTALAEATGWTFRSRADGDPGPTDVRLRLLADPGELVVATGVGATPLHRRAYRAQTVPGALHPPLARALLRVADLRPGETLLDPLCGGGTIVAEAAGAVHGRLIGIDRSRHAVAVAARTVAAARRAHGDGPDVTLHVGDAARLPLPAASVDVVATNPPWGRDVGATGELAGGYRPLALEVLRVLSPAARVVVVEPSGGPLVATLAAAGLRPEPDPVWVRVRGRPVDVTLLRA